MARERPHLKEVRVNAVGQFNQCATFDTNTGRCMLSLSIFESTKPKLSSKTECTCISSTPVRSRC
jgi:hypothetical protein